MNLNFSMSELIYSETAILKNINNMPDINSLDNLLELIIFCLQPIRDKVGKPLIITSGYRNPQVNKLVGGTETSHHKLGLCADFIVRGMSVEALYQFIKKSGVKYTQLIQEKGEWIHIEYNPKNLKCENLRYNGKSYIKD